MCPMVPTLTCGLVRVKTSLAMGLPRKSASLEGDPAACGGQRAHDPAGMLVRADTASAPGVQAVPWRAGRVNPRDVELPGGLQHPLGVRAEPIRWNLARG